MTLRVVKQDATQEEIEEALAGSVQGKQVFAQAVRRLRLLLYLRRIQRLSYTRILAR
jgi:hypothetical protein